LVVQEFLMLRRWGTVVHARRSRVRFSMRSLYFFIDLILGLIQRLTEISTRIFLWDKGQPKLEADELTAICEPIV
jgi:hypothetical protein